MKIQRNCTHAQSMQQTNGTQWGESQILPQKWITTFNCPFDAAKFVFEISNIN